MSGPTTTTMIEVYADLWCPFAHVGLRAAHRQRRLLERSDVAVQVRAWPLELVNGRPMEPAAVLVQVEHLQEHVAPDMFRDVAKDNFPGATLEALALVERAYRVDCETGFRASLVLRDALFERGQDISDPSVLASVARALGVASPDDTDREAVLADWREGERRGVVGSPHFYCGAESIFCPALQITRAPTGEVAIRRDAARLNLFLEHCLADQLS